VLINDGEFLLFRKFHHFFSCRICDTHFILHHKELLILNNPNKCNALTNTILNTTSSLFPVINFAEVKPHHHATNKQETGNIKQKTTNKQPTTIMDTVSELISGDPPEGEEGKDMSRSEG
jgi:hypothetical protein